MAKKRGHQLETWVIWIFKVVPLFNVVLVPICWNHIMFAHHLCYRSVRITEQSDTSNHQSSINNLVPALPGWVDAHHYVCNTTISGRPQDVRHWTPMFSGIAGGSNLLFSQSKSICNNLTIICDCANGRRIRNKRSKTPLHWGEYEKACPKARFR